MSQALPTISVRRARPEDRPRVEQLLEAEGLPRAGISDHFQNYLVAVTAGGLVGAIGLERHGEAGLLRSAVVAPEVRDRGVGGLLTARLLLSAKAQGVRQVYLLTTTAAEYFERMGFRRVERAQLPAELSASEELRGACPESAVCMERDLESVNPAEFFRKQPTSRPGS